MTVPDRWQTRSPVAAALLAGVLSLVWARWLAHDAGDLVAQYAWTDFVRHHPRSAYNLSWYDGIHPASYSVLSPYLMAWMGVRTTGVLAGVGCAALGALALTRSGVRRPMLPSLWLAVAVWANLAAGRVTYLLGMVFAVATVVLTGAGAGPGRRAVLAALLGVVAALCSPVAGLFVEVLVAALFLAGRRRRAWLLAAGPPVVIGVISLLFPFSGVQPFPWYAALLTIGIAVAVAVLTPRSWWTVRAGAGCARPESPCAGRSPPRSAATSYGSRYWPGRRSCCAPRPWRTSSGRPGSPSAVSTTTRPRAPASPAAVNGPSWSPRPPALTPSQPATRSTGAHRARPPIRPARSRSGRPGRPRRSR